jgi:hypothetical protein
MAGVDPVFLKRSLECSAEILMATSRFRARIAGLVDLSMPVGADGREDLIRFEMSPRG